MSGKQHPWYNISSVLLVMIAGPPSVNLQFLTWLENVSHGVDRYEPVQVQPHSTEVCL